MGSAIFKKGNQTEEVEIEDVEIVATAEAQHNVREIRGLPVPDFVNKHDMPANVNTPNIQFPSTGKVEMLDNDTLVYKSYVHSLSDATQLTVELPRSDVTLMREDGTTMSGGAILRRA